MPNLDEYLGQTIQTKVIELNRSRNNVVLSRRAVLEEERKEQRQAILERLQPGLIIEGQISNIVDFGAFVDLDGIDGLIHISELSWSHVNHPSEVLSIGQTVEVKVLDIDRDRQRISLGLKQTQEDPWQRVVDTYHVGDELEGAVTKVVAFGAFVEILEGVEGLVHISELAQQHVENPREIVAAGRRGQGQDPRDRLRAPPALAVDQAGRGPGPPAPHRRPDRRRRRPRGHAGARPVRGRLRRGARPSSRTTRPRRRSAEAAVEDAPVDEVPRTRTFQVEPSAVRSRTTPVEASEARGVEEAPADEAEAPAAEDGGPSRPPTTRLPPPKKSDCAAVRRPDGRHRRREVRGACGTGAPRGVGDLHRQGRPRALRGPRGDRRGGGALGRRGRARRRRRSRRDRAPRLRRRHRAALPRVPAVAARGRAGGAVARARGGEGRRARWSSRPRCCSRRAWRAATTRRSRSWPTRRSARSAPGARGHEALDERTARQLPQTEKAARATYAVENSGSLRDLEQELSGVLAKLSV